MNATPGGGAGAGDTPSGIIHVTATLHGLGGELGLLIAEDPSRFADFLEEAELLDEAYKRWEYVRGANGIPGAGANVVGQLPPDMPYTGFEGYWAGSAKASEDVAADEAAMGAAVLQNIARLAGVEHAWHAGLDITQNPGARGLLDTALGKNYDLTQLQRLAPLFGELLGRLRSQAETSHDPQAYGAFQTDVEAAVRGLTPSVYRDPAQRATLADLARAGKNVEGRDIEEEYDLPRARVTNQHANGATLHGRERDGYHLMTEIGRLGHPLVRALLHISHRPSSARLEFYAPIDTPPSSTRYATGADAGTPETRAM
jgi:hypothetical protein